MPVLVDTNILLRSAQPNHPLCKASTWAVSQLLRQHEEVYFCAQNITEFWNVATRPTNTNGLGMSLKEASEEIADIETTLPLLPDSELIYPEWKRLVKDFNVLGVKVYDARLVAIMNVYGVTRILTYNVADFKRYPNLAVIHPDDV